MKAKAMFKNDCEKAFDILAARPDSIFRGATGTVEMRRKLEGRGELSDGTRVFIIRPCDRFRYLIVDLGWKTLAEVDQREYFNHPEEMADAVAAAVYSYEPHPKPPATIPTPAQAATRQLGLFD